jgi:acetyltransferase-like isoleucine patch superfamily enzyme
MKSILLALRFLKGLERRLRTCILVGQGLRIGKGSFIGRGDIKNPHLIEMGDGCMIDDEVSLMVYTGTNSKSSGPSLLIGSNVHISRQTIFLCQGFIKIGDNVMVAPSCLFVDHNHGYKSRQLPIREQPGEVGQIVIEDDVWIGAGCKILKGVTIEKGAIIGAGSVVTKNVSTFEIWAGVPARHISTRPI